MASISDLTAVAREVRELIKGIVPSTSGDGIPDYFVTTCPALTVTKFSLPSRCSWVQFYAASAFNYAFASQASLAFLPAAANTTITFQGNGPLDLSTLHLHCIAASSGTTVSAWVSAAAPLA